jgi:hypothetical protein
MPSADAFLEKLKGQVIVENITLDWLYSSASYLSIIVN